MRAANLALLEVWLQFSHRSSRNRENCLISGKIVLISEGSIRVLWLVWWVGTLERSFRGVSGILSVIWKCKTQIMTSWSEQKRSVNCREFSIFGKGSVPQVWPWQGLSSLCEKQEPVHADSRPGVLSVTWSGHVCGGSAWRGVPSAGVSGPERFVPEGPRGMGPPPQWRQWRWQYTASRHPQKSTTFLPILPDFEKKFLGLRVGFLPFVTGCLAFSKRFVLEGSGEIVLACLQVGFPSTPHQF